MKIVRKRAAVFQLLVLIFLLTVFIVNVATASQSKDTKKSSGQASEQVADTATHKDPHDASAPHDKADTHHGHANLGEILPLWSCIPFAMILLSIALFPLVLPDFWHHHFGKISAFWAATLGIPFLIAFKGDALYEILHIILADYVPFIILLWSLYTGSAQRAAQ